MQEDQQQAGAAPDAQPGQGQPQGQWQFRPEGETPQPQTTGPSSQQPGAPAVEWTASEFVAHSKGALWYAGLLGVAAAIVAAVYLITHDVVSTAVVAVFAVIFGVVAARPPRVMHYQLANTGVAIGNRYYPFRDFRAFSVIDEGAFSSIVFWPMKRFRPSLGIYYAPADEDKIVDVIAAQLPLEMHQLDAIERLMRRIRF